MVSVRWSSTRSYLRRRWTNIRRFERRAWQRGRETTRVSRIRRMSFVRRDLKAEGNAQRSTKIATRGGRAKSRRCRREELRTGSEGVLMLACCYTSVLYVRLQLYGCYGQCAQTILSTERSRALSSGARRYSVCAAEIREAMEDDVQHSAVAGAQDNPCSPPRGLVLRADVQFLMMRTASAATYVCTYGTYLGSYVPG
jgi:hypothetical protein